MPPQLEENILPTQTIPSYILKKNSICYLYKIMRKKSSQTKHYKITYP